MSFKATLKASISGTLSGANDLGDAVQTFAELVEIAIGDGTGADQATNIFSDERTLVASATENLDLAGVLVNALGLTLAFTAIKAIMIVASAGNTNDVVIGGAASNTFAGEFADATDKINIGPGDVFLITRRSAAGLPVVAGTGDILKVANGGAGTPVTYKVIIIGEA
jgi:predicted RNA-binding protein